MDDSNRLYCSRHLALAPLTAPRTIAGLLSLLSMYFLVSQVSTSAQTPPALKLEVQALKGTVTQTIEFTADSKFITSSTDQYGTVWDTETGSLVSSVDAPEHDESPALCGKQLAYLDRNVLHLSTIQSGGIKELPGFGDGHVRCNLAGTIAAVLTYRPQRLIIVSLPDGRVSSPVPVDELGFYDMRFVSDTQVAIWSSDHIFLYDLHYGLKSWLVKENGPRPINAAIWRGDLLVAEYNEETNVFDIRNLRSGRTLRRKRCHCESASFSRRSGFVGAVDSSTPGHIYVWNLSGGIVLSMNTAASPDLIALNADASKIAIESQSSDSSSWQTSIISLATPRKPLLLDATQPLFVTKLGQIYGGNLLTASAQDMRIWNGDKGSIKAETNGVLLDATPSAAEKSPVLAIPFGSYIYGSRQISVYTTASKNPLIIPTAVQGRTTISDDGKYVAWGEPSSTGTVLRIADTIKGVPGDAGCHSQLNSSFGFSHDNDTLYSWCRSAGLIDNDQVCIYRPGSGLPLSCKTLAKYGIPLGFGDSSKSFYYAQPLIAGGKTVELRAVETDTLNETLVATLDGRPRKWISRIGNSTQLAILFDDRIELYDFKSGVLTRRGSIPGLREGASDILWNEEGVLFVAKADSTVELISAAREQTLGYLVQLQSPGDWIFVTPDGRFEGTPTAMRYVGWRDQDGRFFPLDYMFNTFYSPLIFASSMRDRVIPPPQHDLFSELQIPGLRTMVESQVAKIVQHGDKYALCVNQEPDSLLYYSDGNAAAFDPSNFTDGDSDDCLHEYVIPNGQHLEVTTKHGIASATLPTTPWDAEKRSTSPTARLKVLLIGVDTFTRDNSLSLLPAAADSVSTLQGMFEGWRTRSNMGFAGVDIDVLKGRDATAAAIRGAFASLAQQTLSDDVVFIYMVGHGAIPAGQEMYFYLPTDVVSLSMTHLRKTAVSSADLSDLFMRLPAKRVLFFLDSCNSGGALDSIVKVGSALASVEIANENTKRARTTASLYGIGLYLYASSSPLNRLQMPDHGPTPLAQLLKRRLDVQAPSELWTADLARFLSTEMQAGGFSQAPISLRVGFDFNFFPTP